MGEGVKSLIPDGKIRISGVDFTSLLFRQIDRINETSGGIYSVPMVSRKDAMITYRKHVFNLQALMWAKLKNDKDFIAEREKLDLFSLKTLGLLRNTSDLPHLMEFDFIIEKWYQLLMEYMKKFNFYPPTDVGFISGKKEVGLGRIRDAEE